jgi:hypothetical protein
VPAETTVRADTALRAKTVGVEAGAETTVRAGREERAQGEQSLCSHEVMRVILRRRSSQSRGRHESRDNGEGNTCTSSGFNTPRRRLDSETHTISLLSTCRHTQAGLLLLRHAQVRTRLLKLTGLLD